MTALDLDAIKARADNVANGHAAGGQVWLAYNINSAGDVPALVAEVKRLRNWVLEAKLALHAATVIGTRHGVGLHYANQDRLVTEAERDLLPGLPGSSDLGSTGSEL